MKKHTFWATSKTQVICHTNTLKNPCRVFLGWFFSPDFWSHRNGYPVPGTPNWRLQRSRWKCVGHPPEMLVGIVSLGSKRQLPMAWQLLAPAPKSLRCFFFFGNLSTFFLFKGKHMHKKSIMMSVFFFLRALLGHIGSQGTVSDRRVQFNGAAAWIFESNDEAFAVKIPRIRCGCCWCYCLQNRFFQWKHKSFSPRVFECLG